MCFPNVEQGAVLWLWNIKQNIENFAGSFIFKWVSGGVVLCAVLCCIFLNAISLTFIENVNRREINAGLICGLIFESSIQSVLADETAVPHF